MDPQPERNERPAGTAGDAVRGSYLRLCLKLILPTLLCTVDPLLLAGWTVYHNYSKFSYDRMSVYF
jgi:hypothetical protein